MAVVHCSQCGAELPLQAELRFFLNGQRMCNSKCMHDAGCRDNCGPWCSCTSYAIKRRMLREHRELMRCMESVINENGLDEELYELWRKNCQGHQSRDICLNYDSEMDEASDADDPEQQLRAELADRSALVEAVQGVLECRHIKESDGNGRRSDAVLPSEKG